MDSYAHRYAFWLAPKALLGWSEWLNHFMSLTHGILLYSPRIVRSFVDGVYYLGVSQRNPTT